MKLFLLVLLIGAAFAINDYNSDSDMESDNMNSSDDDSTDYESDYDSDDTIPKTSSTLKGTETLSKYHRSLPNLKKARDLISPPSVSRRIAELFPCGGVSKEPIPLECPAGFTEKRSSACVNLRSLWQATTTSTEYFIGTSTWDIKKQIFLKMSPTQTLCTTPTTQQQNILNAMQPGVAKAMCECIKKPVEVHAVIPEYSWGKYSCAYSTIGLLPPAMYAKPLSDSYYRVHVCSKPYSTIHQLHYSPCAEDDGEETWHSPPDYTCNGGQEYGSTPANPCSSNYKTKCGYGEKEWAASLCKPISQQNGYLGSVKITQTKVADSSSCSKYKGTVNAFYSSQASADEVTPQYLLQNPSKKVRIALCQNKTGALTFSLAYKSC